MNRRHHWGWTVTLVGLLSACGSSPPSGEEQDASEHDAASGADSSMTDVLYCRVGCVTAADCGTPGVPLNDADNYECEGGLCRWTGCRSDDECRSALGRTNVRCSDRDAVPQCVQLCARSSDCGSGAATDDADNYDCSAEGECVYTGCRDDSECASAFSNSRYVCRRMSWPVTGFPSPSFERGCVLSCTSAADCSSGTAALDADNYECSAEGACVYSGCRDDAECQATFMTGHRYLCR